VTPLAIAVERRDWHSVALYLLLGVSQAASALPQESLVALLDLLDGDEETGNNGVGDTRGN
jgi:hypothetical protein